MDRTLLKTSADELLRRITGFRSQKAWVASASKHGSLTKAMKLVDEAATEIHRAVHHREQEHVYRLTMSTRVISGDGELELSFAHDDDGARAAAFIQQLETLGFRVEEVK